MNQSISTLKDTLNIDISSDNKGLEIIKDFFASRFLFDIAHLDEFNFDSMFNEDFFNMD